jgi:hypothetical protein
MAPTVATYAPRDPSRTVLSNVMAEHLETLLASRHDDPNAKGFPAYGARELSDDLQGGILAYGFLRLGCDTGKKEVLLPRSWKRWGVCPSCAGRRMAQTAAHVVERVMPWVPTRQGVVSGPIPLRSWMSSSRDLMTQVPPIVRTTIAPFYINQAVKRGGKRQNVPPGSGSCIQRFGRSINVHRHFHIVCLEGVDRARTEVDLTPRLLTVEPPGDADSAEVLQKMSRRVIRKLRHRGDLAAGMDVPVATGYDPRLDHEPALARSMVASVTQRLACGKRAGQRGRRIGSGCGSEGERPERKGSCWASVNGFSLHAHTSIPAQRRDQLERLMRSTGRGAVSLERLEQDASGEILSRFNRPWSDGTTGSTLSPLELLEKLAARVPLPRAHLVRYGGCLAPHSTLRAVIIPTPRQQGVDGEASKTGTPYWSWARLLGRVFALGMATCPLCRRGALRIIAATLPPLCGRREPCDLHPGVGDDPHPASPSAGLRSPSHCPGPPPPRDMCVRRRPRQREPRGEVCAATASFAPLQLCNPL